METKYLGLMIMGISVAMFVVLYSFTADLNSHVPNTCMAPDATCPRRGMLPIQSYLGFTMDVILFIFGLNLFLGGRKQERFTGERRAELEKAVKGLGPDEKMVFKALDGSEGVMFQSDLAEKTGLAKVKVTRILDRLEGKGIVERRRRGMSNVIILRHR